MLPSSSRANVSKPRYLQIAARDYVQSFLAEGKEPTITKTDVNSVTIECGEVAIYIDGERKKVCLDVRDFSINANASPATGAQSYSINDERFHRHEMPTQISMTMLEFDDILMVPMMVKLLRQGDITPKEAMLRLLDSQGRSGWLIRTDGKTGIEELLDSRPHIKGQVSLTKEDSK